MTAATWRDTPGQTRPSGAQPARREVRSPTAVVGARGFIGGRLCHAMDCAGIPVVRLGRPRDRYEWIRFVAALCRVDVVFWAASTFTPALAEVEPDRVMADRLALSMLLAGCRRGGRRPTVVLLSSGGTVYAPGVPPPYPETAPTGPTGVYGKAKLDQENQLLDASDQIRPIVLRLSNVYGPGQPARGGLGVVSHWLDAARRGEPLRLFGDPATQRDFVYVDDVTDAMLRVYRRQTGMSTPAHLDGAVLNIGAGRPTSLAELLDLVRSTVGGAPRVEHVAGRAFDRRDVWLDVRAATEALGWLPETSLRDGVARTWRSLLASIRDGAGSVA